MKNAYIYAIAKVGGKPEPFNLLVSEEQKERILRDGAFRNTVVEKARLKIEQVLRIGSGKHWSLDVMPPTGPNYDKYLKVLSGLDPVALDATTINLVSDLN